MILTLHTETSQKIDRQGRKYTEVRTRLSFTMTNTANNRYPD